MEIYNRYSQPGMNVPEVYKDKVLHARFHFGKNTIMAGDIFPGQSAQKSSGDVALSLTMDDTEHARKIFDALAEDGEVQVSFEK